MDAGNADINSDEGAGCEVGVLLDEMIASQGSVHEEGGDKEERMNVEPVHIPKSKPILLLDLKREKMAKALDAVKGGMSIRKASQTFELSQAAISSRVNKGENTPYRRGRRPRLTIENEKELVSWCVEMTKIGCPQTRKGLPYVVKAILDSKKISLFPPDNLPTVGWVDKFLVRHNVLTNRVPEHLGHLRAAVKYCDIQAFFTVLEDYLLKEHQLEAKNFLTEENSNRIFNCDESGFFVNANDKSSKVLVKKGSRNAYKLGGESKLMITVLMCVSASGEVLKPLIVNKGKTPTLYECHEDLKRSSYNVACSDNGWMTGEIFFSWLSNLFHKEVSNLNVQRPIILFLDGHASHLLLETIYFARDHGIILYCFPPHASHILQPLDVAVFHSIKMRYRETVEQCRGSLTKTDLPKKQFPYVLMKSMEKSDVSKNTVSGFKAAGLVPFNPKAIKRNKFLNANEEENSNEGRESEIGDTVEPQNVPRQTIQSETLAQAFLEGYKLAQCDDLARLEALIPLDELELYNKRIQNEPEGPMFTLPYYIWRELKSKPPLRSNPYQDDPHVPAFKNLIETRQSTSLHQDTIVQTEPSGTDEAVAGPSHRLHMEPDTPSVSSACTPDAGTSTSISQKSPLGVSPHASASARRRILSSPPEHFQESPFKSYLVTPKEIISSKKKGQVKRKLPSAMTSEDYIAYLENKEIEKKKKEEEKNKRKQEREAKRLEKLSSKGKKRKAPAKGRFEEESETEDSELEMMDTDDGDVSEELEENKCAKCKKSSGRAASWIGCEGCPRWFHKLCVSVPLTLSNIEIGEMAFKCDFCNEN